MTRTPNPYDPPGVEPQITSHAGDPNESPPVRDGRLLRWQGITLVSLTAGYMGYYFCRSNFSVAIPLIEAEFKGQPLGSSELFGPLFQGIEGIDKKALGLIASIGSFFYAIGKISNGIVSDFLGGRLMFLGAMIASVACTIGFGLSSGLSLFLILWAINRLVQSTGWVAMMKVASRWFPYRYSGSIMAFISMSYLAGDALTRMYLGLLLSWGYDWRQLFFASAAVLGTVALICGGTVKPSPRSLGMEEPEASPTNVYGAKGEDPHPEGLLALILPYLQSPVFWIVCLLSAGLTVLRETFNTWNTTLLVEVGGFVEDGQAAGLSALFPWFGLISLVVCGILADSVSRFRDPRWTAMRYALIMLPFLGLLVGSLVWIWMMPKEDASGTPLVFAICLVALGLIGPYSFLGGAVAMDKGAKRGSATAAGLIDAAGYFPATFAGYPIGRLIEELGWSSTFLVLLVVAGSMMIAALIYAVLEWRTIVRRKTVAPLEDFVPGA